MLPHKCIVSPDLMSTGQGTPTFDIDSGIGGTVPPLYGKGKSHGQPFHPQPLLAPTYNEENFEKDDEGVKYPEFDALNVFSVEHPPISDAT